MSWDLGKAIGEMMGSLILTLGVLLTAMLVKRNEKFINTPFKKRLVNAVAFGASVVIGIMTSIGLGSGGAINPAVALMVGVAKDNYEYLLVEVGFELVGAVAAALIFIVTVKLWDDAPKLSDVFAFSNQSAKKAAGIESLANMFWLLPVMGIIAAGSHNVGGVSLNEHAGIAITAAFALVAVIIFVEQIGAPNLNPQVWFGVFIIKMISQKGKISGKQFVSELTGLATVFIAAAAVGGLFYGVVYK